MVGLSATLITSTTAPAVIPNSRYCLVIHKIRNKTKTKHARPRPRPRPSLPDQDQDQDHKLQDQDQIFLISDRSCNKTKVSDQFTGLHPNLYCNFWYGTVHQRSGLVWRQPYLPDSFRRPCGEVAFRERLIERDGEEWGEKICSCFNKPCWCWI